MKIRKLIPILPVLALVFAGAAALVTHPAYAADDEDTTTAKTWVGAGADAKFSTPANWSDNLAPVKGDKLVFDYSKDLTGKQTKPVNDMTDLEVTSISFTGKSTSKYPVETPNLGTISVSESITNDSTYRSVVWGSVTLTGDVTARGVNFAPIIATNEDGKMPTTESTIDLNSHKLRIEDTTNASAQAYGIYLFTPISGDGTFEIDAPKSDIVIGATNTYKGTTTIANDKSLWMYALDGNINSLFGTSKVEIADVASVGILVSAANNNQELKNAITIDGFSDQAIASLSFANLANYLADVTIPSELAGNPVVAQILEKVVELNKDDKAVKLKVSGVTLKDNTRMGVYYKTTNVTVDLKGIVDNDYCIMYWDGSAYKDSLKYFVNGPAVCNPTYDPLSGDNGEYTDSGSTDSTTTGVGVPSTGIPQILRNPATIAVAGLVLAAVVYLASRRFAKAS